MKVATFLASATEIVCALGLRERLVGVSHECDWPDAASPWSIAALPRLTRARVDGGKPSRAIHDDVEALVRSALALYEVDLDALRKVAPDLLVTQDLCAVCAVGLDDVQRAAVQVLGKDVSIVSLAPRRLAEVWDDVARVGDACGLGMTARALATGLRSRIDTLRGRSEAAAAARGAGVKRPTVLAIEWLDPIMVGGLWMPDLIEAAGGTALVGRAGEPGVVLADDVEVDPDVIVVKPCGFDLARVIDEIGAPGEGPQGGHLSRLQARWPRARIVAADGNALFNRSGPRLVESAEVLFAILYPEAAADIAARLGRWFRTAVATTSSAVESRSSGRNA